MILESFAMIAVMFGITLLVGAGFGVFRLWLLRRYPDNPFNGRGKDPSRIDLS